MKRQQRERNNERLQNKIDFAVVLRVKHANPNGDPLNGNRPRTDYNGFGEISDVCLKRKIRDRLQDAGLDIFVQSDDRKKDDAKSLRDRADKVSGSKFGSAKRRNLLVRNGWTYGPSGNCSPSRRRRGRPKLGRRGKRYGTFHSHPRPGHTAIRLQPSTRGSYQHSNHEERQRRWRRNQTRL